MWVRRVDPDNSAIPYLTALGDLLGTALLAIAFLVLFSIGDKDADVGDWYFNCLTNFKLICTFFNSVNLIVLNWNFVKFLKLLKLI